MIITGFSTALYATWLFIEDIGVLFDAGDGVSAGLLQKSGKVKNIFLSHADRDHIAGLLQFNYVNARDDRPVVYYPSGCASVNDLEGFTKHFDPKVAVTRWNGLAEDDCVAVSLDTRVRALPNLHVPVGATGAHAMPQSLSFLVERRKRRLRKELAGTPGYLLGKIREEKGEDTVTEVVYDRILGYSGDSPVDPAEKWEGVEVLIHEATFLHRRDVHPRGDRHSSLEDVMAMACQIKGLRALVLAHFSTRYSNRAIDRAILHCCEEFRAGFPVFRILPGETVHDLLAGSPVHAG